MKLRIKNFQSFEDCEFEIKDFTTLVGPSNRGKSAIVRALACILYNDWNASYLRFGAKDCELTLELEESESHNLKKITLLKGSKNEYVLEYISGEIKRFPKVGKETPDELRQIGFDLVETERGDKFNLNLQRQLDPLFMLNNADFELPFTGFLNKIFNLGAYEGALRNIQTDLTKNNSEWKETHDQINQMDAMKGELESSIEDIQSKKEFLKGLLDSIEGLNSKIELVDFAIESRQQLLEQEKEVSALKKTLEITKSISNQLSRLQSSILKVGSIKKEKISLIQVSNELSEQKGKHKVLYLVKDSITSLKRILQTDYHLWTAILGWHQVEKEKTEFRVTLKIVEPLKKYLNESKKVYEFLNTQAQFMEANKQKVKVESSISLLDKLKSNLSQVNESLNKRMRISLARSNMQLDTIKIKEEKASLGLILEASRLFQEVKSIGMAKISKCPTCGNVICKETV